MLSWFILSPIMAPLIYCRSLFLVKKNEGAEWTCRTARRSERLIGVDFDFLPLLPSLRQRVARDYWIFEISKPLQTLEWLITALTESIRNDKTV